MKRVSVLLLTIIYTICFVFGASSVSVKAADKDDVDKVIRSIPEDWPAAPSLAAKSAILMDADSGEILYAKNATEAMFPASTTKLVTALLTAESSPMNDIVEFSSKAVNIPSGSSHIGMRRGEKMVLKECLLGLLLPSANEVANALAEHVSGSIGEFVVRMNEKVYQLGGVNTVFTNPNGLHDEDHHTCAYDLALVMREFSQNDTLVNIASQQSYVHHADDLLPKDIPMTNTHMMIRSSEYHNEYVVCGKTGHTAESGYNLVTYAEKDGVHLIVVVMGCENGSQYVATQSLLDYGFNYFHLVLPAELDSSLDLQSSFTSSSLALPTPGVSLLTVDSSDSILLPDTVTFDKLDKTVEDTDDGKLVTYTYQGYPLGTVTLSYSSAKASNPLFVPEEDVDLTPQPVPNLSMLDGYLLLTIVGLTIVLILVITVMVRWNHPRKKKKTTYK